MAFLFSQEPPFPPAPLGKLIFEPPSPIVKPIHPFKPFVTKSYPPTPQPIWCPNQPIDPHDYFSILFFHPAMGLVDGCFLQSTRSFSLNIASPESEISSKSNKSNGLIFEESFNFRSICQSLTNRSNFTLIAILRGRMCFCTLYTSVFLCVYKVVYLSWIILLRLHK